MNSELVRARLKDGALERLASVVVDFLLDRPVNTLLEPGWVADQLVATLETSARGPRTEAWLREKVAGRQDWIPAGTLGEHIPKEVSDPLRGVMARDFQPDRELMGQLVHHDAIEQMFRDVLIESLQAFAKNLRPVIPENVRAQAQASKGFGRLKALGQGVRELSDGVLASGVLGGLSQELEVRAEHRIREFVDGAIGRVLDQATDHMCATENVQLYGAYRAHLLDTVLATSNAKMAREFDKLDPESLVETIAASARALAGREGLRDELRQLMETVMESTDGRSLRDFLQESGLDGGVEQWRQSVQDLVLARGKEVIETKEFESWLHELLSE